MHLSEHELYLASEELLPDAWRHLGECDQCQGHLEQARAFEARVPDLLRRLDRPTASFSARTVIAIARTRASERAQRRRRAVIGGIATLLATSAAAAAVSSPTVRSWFARLLSSGSTSHSKQAAPMAPPNATPATPLQNRGGIAFVPSPGLSIAFRYAQPTGVVHILLTASTQVRVEHVGGTPRYELTRQGVMIDNASPGASYVISIPKTSDNVVVRVRDLVVFSKEKELFTGVAVSEGADAYQIDFSTLNRSVR